MNLLIIGAGGHGKVCKEIAEALNIYDKIDYVDDCSEQVIGKIADLEKLRSFYDAAFVGIGNNVRRNELICLLDKLGYLIQTLIHPTAFVSKSARIGMGTIVEPKAIVNANCKLGKGCIVSVGAIVDHDCVLEDCVHINAGAICKAGAFVIDNEKIDAGQIVKGY